VRRSARAGSDSIAGRLPGSGDRSSLGGRDGVEEERRPLEAGDPFIVVCIRASACRLTASPKRFSTPATAAIDAASQHQSNRITCEGGEGAV